MLDYSGGFLLEDLYRPSGARSIKAALTQGSQSLALGLTLTAAPQLVEGSRLISSGPDRIDTRVPVPAGLQPPNDSLALRCVKFVNPVAKPCLGLNSDRCSAAG